MSYRNLQQVIGMCKVCMFCQVKQKYKNLDVKVATDKNVSVNFFASPFRCNFLFLSAHIKSSIPSRVLCISTRDLRVQSYQKWFWLDMFIHLEFMVFQSSFILIKSSKCGHVLQFHCGGCTLLQGIGVTMNNFALKLENE